LKPAAEPTVISQDDVETAIPLLVEASASEFEPLWDDLDIAEQLYVAILARVAGPLATMSESEVVEAIDAQLVRLRPHKLSWTADELVERQILSLDEAEEYRFTLPLFQAWIKHHKPPLLVKEKLDQLINSQADELFQRGREAFVAGQYQKATSYFRQAIRDNPYHVGAQLALGTSLLALGFAETAAQRLERAYKLDAIEAKYPLAEALVITAETHLQADDRRAALAVCERFQSLDSHNPEWLERIKTVETAVWNWRGDIALQRGFIDKALTAYSNAGNTEKIAQLNGNQPLIEPSSELESEAEALMQAEAWPEAVAAYEKLLGVTQDAEQRASFQKSLSQCLEEVDLAQYFDEGVKALENNNWLLARMSFMHVITRRMNYTRHGERALALLDKAAKGHAFTSMLRPSAANVPEPPSPKSTVPASPKKFSEAEVASSQTPVDVAAGGVITTGNVNQVGYLERLGKGAITNMAYSPDGSLLALATALGIYFYDAQTVAELHYIETQVPVQAIAFSPNNEMLATGSWHHSVQLWRVEDGYLLANLEAHESPVLAVAFSPDGNELASGDEDGVIAIWHVDMRRWARLWEAHKRAITAVAFSPDGDNLLASSLDQTISLWQIDNGKQLMSLQKHEEAVTQIAFTPDGHRFFSASRDYTAALWRLDETSRLRLRRPSQAMRATLLYTLALHHQAVNDIACSPDGKLVATASSDHSIRLWNADNGTVLHEFKGHVSPVTAVAFSPDGQTLASATESLVQLWDVPSRHSGQAIEGHMGALQSVDVSANGRLLAAADAAAVERASALAKERGAMRALPLAVSAPFHCSLMAPAAEVMERELAAVDFADPEVPVVANVDARPVAGGDGARRKLVEQVASPVRWVQSVEAMAGMGVDTFIEVGPGKVLCGLIRRIVPGATCISLSEPDALVALLDEHEGRETDG
jgi:WD40 repeat protein/tetratricopeptide (TPR) repeat protein